jgi:hypothetical protein
MRRVLIVSMVAALAITATSCATKVRTIKENPDEYVDKKVTMSGEVAKVHLIPHSPLNLLGFRDDTDTILVLTDNEVRRGSAVTVSGEIISMGGRMTGQRATYVERKIADFLIHNGLATKKQAYPASKKVLIYLFRALPKARRTMVLLESKVY